MKKKYIIIFSLLLLIIIGAVITIVFFPQIFKRYHITKTVDVFGAPRSQTQQNFPTNKPQFTAVISDIKSKGLKQQSVTMYRFGDAKRTPVFARSFYADNFRGNELTYTVSSSSAEIVQTGNLGTIGCNKNECKLPWSNFYIWGVKQKSFVLDNASHKDAFQELLTTYQKLDASGCSLISGDTTQEDTSSFTDLYKNHPTDTSYCSKSQGIFPSNLVFFLQAEKVLTNILNGDNIGSADIRNIPL